MLKRRSKSLPRLLEKMSNAEAVMLFPTAEKCNVIVQTDSLH
jgi:hypothetical protein